MRSGPEPFGSADVQRLVAAQQEEMRGRYGGVGDIGPSREASMFVEPDGVFLLVRDDDGRAIGCGGVCRFDEGRAELKRMYVSPDTRGRGLGRRLLVDLEAHAQRLGYRGIVLETGTRNHEALALYASFGYEPIPCYGVYAQQATSRCFEKTFRTPQTG
jgi:GNAT superfamily N-acetyltransferase